MTVRSSDIAASATSRARVRRHHSEFFVVVSVVCATLAFVIAVGLIGLLAVHSALR